MPTGTLTSRSLSEGEEDEDDHDDKEDLVSVLESYTRELGALCGGLEVQQLEVEDEELDDDVDISTDTLTSLEEMADECAVLLACLEAGEHSLDETENGDAVNGAVEGPAQEKEQQQQAQKEEPNEPYHREELALELDNFADELKEFLLCLGDPGMEGNDRDTQVSASSSIEDAICQRGDEKKTLSGGHDEDNFDAAAAPTAGSGGGSDIEVVVGTDGTNSDTDVAPTAAAIGGSSDDDAVDGTDGANPPHKEEVFNERTKKAIALHVKRRQLQNQCRSCTGTRFRISNQANAGKSGADIEQGRTAGVKVVWSRFQSTSFQQHIIRQKFARRRVQQVQEAQHLLESARLRGTTGTSYRHSAKSGGGKTEKNATYLDQFTSASTHSVPSNEFQPRYLCAVYLYDLRRLGTTYITFNSLAQFEQRVRARFAIEKFVSIYREVTEVVLPQPSLGHHTNRQRSLRRLHRISSLEHVNDGDTLCVTQNAYDDMTILCDWIKRRQRVVHGFQFEVHQPPADVSSGFTDEESTLPKPKANDNAASNPQLWDSNGRSIGVKAQCSL